MAAVVFYFNRINITKISKKDNFGTLLDNIEHDY